METLRVSIDVERADRGYIVRHEAAIAGVPVTSRNTAMLEGQLGSANLIDRVRRHVTAIMRELFPDGRNQAAADDESGG